MNFVLIHFLAKSGWTFLVLAVHIVWVQSQCEWNYEKEQNKLEASASMQKETAMMEKMEDKQSAADRKGLQQRKSYYTIMEHDIEKDTSVEMRRQDSSLSSLTSQKSFSSLASDGWVKDSTEDQVTTTGQPHNFGTVVPGVYRSSYPKEADYPFIQKLGLKTIVTLVDKEFPETFLPFMEVNGIRHCHITMEGTKKQTIPIKTMQSIMEVVHNKQNHPVLIHCNQGRHRTGCVVAITRKIQQWSVEHILDEYKNYAQPKIRDCDVEYITQFQVAEIDHLGLVPLMEIIPVQPRVIHRPIRHYIVATLLIIMFLSILSVSRTPDSGHRRTPMLGL